MTYRNFFLQNVFASFLFFFIDPFKFYSFFLTKVEVTLLLVSSEKKKRILNTDWTCSQITLILQSIIEERKFFREENNAFLGFIAFYHPWICFLFRLIKFHIRLNSKVWNLNIVHKPFGLSEWLTEISSSKLFWHLFLFSLVRLRAQFFFKQRLKLLCS